MQWGHCLYCSQKPQQEHVEHLIQAHQRHADQSYQPQQTGTHACANKKPPVFTALQLLICDDARGLSLPVWQAVKQCLTIAVHCSTCVTALVLLTGNHRSH